MFSGFWSPHLLVSSQPIPHQNTLRNAQGCIPLSGMGKAVDAMKSTPLEHRLQCRGVLTSGKGMDNLWQIVGKCGKHEENDGKMMGKWWQHEEQWNRTRIIHKHEATWKSGIRTFEIVRTWGSSSRGICNKSVLLSCSAPNGCCNMVHHVAPPFTFTRFTMVLRKTMLHLPSSPLACNSTGWCRIWWSFRCPKILKDNAVYNNVR